MSWKSFVTAGLLCALAAPAFAAPTIQVTKGTAGEAPNSNNYLDASGNFVWQLRLSQSNPIVDIDDGGPIPAGSPLAAEFGFRAMNGGAAGTTSASAVTAAVPNATDFDDPNPGNAIFGWEDLTPLGGTGACDSGNPGNCPVGLLWDGNDASAPENEVFSAFGSVDYLGDDNGKDYLRLTTRGPNTGTTLGPDGKLRYTVSVVGAYGTGTGGPGTTDTGRIAELNDAYDGTPPPAISLNHDGYNNVFTRTVIPGDADLDGDAGSNDLSLVLSNWVGGGKGWFNGNFDNHLDDDVTSADLSILLSNWTTATGPVGNSPGVGGGSAGVPEPASITLLALAGLGIAGLSRRRS